MTTFNIILTKAYDVAGEVNLELVQRMLVNKNPDKFRLRKFHREMSIQDPPVILNLGEQDYIMDGQTYRVSITGKVWNYGAVSLNFKIPVQSDTCNKLTDLIFNFEQDPFFENIGTDLVNDIIGAIAPAVKDPNTWEELEDYTVIQFVAPRGCLDLPESFNFDELARLVEGQKNLTLSNQILEQIKNSLFQYSDEDLIIIDWNRAVIMGDQEEVEELTGIVEFAICQLLEMRFYDNLLDQKISNLYKAIKSQQSTFFSNRYAKLAHEASLLFIELSEVIELVENSLKVIGDTYYAKVYRVAIDRFQIPAWRRSISQKLDNLSNISSLFSSEINERRNQLMELIIIILIAIEVVPFVWNLVQGIQTH